MFSQLKNNLIQAKDLVPIGIFAALYFIAVILSNVVLFIIPGYSYVYIPVASAFLAGPVFMLLVSRVPRFGAITILGLLMGLNFFLTGRYPASLPYAVIIALIADYIAYTGQYRSQTHLTGSYILFSFNTIGPVLPMFLFPDLYVAHLVNQGRDAAYIENAFSSISGATFWILVIGLIVAGAAGAWLGFRLLKKHFKRSGIV